MELLTRAKTIRLRGHLGKYLFADDDQETVRQSRNGSSQKASWFVEVVGGKNIIRLKSCYGKYLTATDQSFLLGMTGNKVLQTVPEKVTDWNIQWEPIREGPQVKFKSSCGKYLRGNGGTPPWRNSVTHDEPYSGATKNWILWHVELVGGPESGSVMEYLSLVSSFSSVSEQLMVALSDEISGSDPQSPVSVVSSLKSPRLSVLSTGSPSLSQKQMEFFTEAKAVRLRGHLDKYLVADDDQETVRQSRNGSSQKARWLVEVVGDKNIIRLKSCHGKYLTATDQPFLLGMTGNKVLQTVPEKVTDLNIQWEPIRDGFQVKFKSWCGKYLRGNGGTPPWRNSVTHDEPHSGATKNWILWDVEVVEVPESGSVMEYLSLVSSFSSVSEQVMDALSDGISVSDPQSPVSVVSPFKSPRLSLLSIGSPRVSQKQIEFDRIRSGMDYFHNAKVVRLRSHHDKFLLAEEDEESVTQDRNGSSKNARWTVEFVSGSQSIIRLKSCYGKYLTASNLPFLLGMTGRKVFQTLPKRLDSSLEWEPVRDGSKVKLKTRYGNFLRANGGVPPWRNSVTHDIPQRTATQDWILWDVDVIEIKPQPTASSQQPTASIHEPTASSQEPSAPPIDHLHSLDFESNSPSYDSAQSGHFSRQESTDSHAGSPPKSEGRTIYYHIADEAGDVDDDSTEGYALSFKGSGVEELTQKLREDTGLDEIVVCTRSPLNRKLYPLRLQLPPNNANMHVVVVPSSSIAAKDFAKQGSTL